MLLEGMKFSLDCRSGNANDWFLIHSDDFFRQVSKEFLSHNFIIVCVDDASNIDS